VLLAPGGDILVAGVFPALAGGGEDGTPGTREAIPGRAGALVRLDPAGRRVLGVTRVGDEIRDADLVRASGLVAMAGDFGVAVVEAGGGRLLWTRALPGGGARIAVGASGTVVALDAQGGAHTFSRDGTRIGTFSLRDGDPRDVALDDRTGSVFVAGARSGTVPGYCSDPVPSAYLRSFDLTGTPRWRNYDWSGQQIVSAGSRRCRHTRATRVVMGRDGKLYMAGESYAGDTPFAFHPRDLGAAAPNVAADGHNRAEATSHHTAIGYIARFDAGSGALEAGQFVVNRDVAGRGGDTFIHAIDVDERGQILLGGAGACCFPARERATLGGEVLGAPRGEGWIALLGPDLVSRRLWTTWSRGGSAAARGVALAGDTVVLVATPEAGGADALVTRHALLATRPGGSDGYVAVLRLGE
jgi:hypothetical protein